jgi:hypothetical protein
MPVNRQRLRELLQELEPTIALVFGSGWKTHTHWGLLANGDFRIETLDGRKIKRLIFSPTGKIRWKGLASDDKNREELQMFKTRTLLRSQTRIRNRPRTEESTQAQTTESVKTQEQLEH